MQVGKRCGIRTPEGVQMMNRATHTQKKDYKVTGVVRTLFDSRAAAAECVTRFVLGFFLARGRLLGDIYPFGIAFVSSSAGGVPLFGSLAGVLLGTITAGDLVLVVMYLAAVILAAGLLVTASQGRFAKDPALPSCTAVTSALVLAVVRCIVSGLTLRAVAAGITEVIMCGACASFFRHALKERKRNAMGSGSMVQALGTAFLAAAALTALADVRLFEIISLGKLLAIGCVQLAALAGGAGAGAISGAIFGLAMDMADGTLCVYGAACGLAGAVMGCMRSRGRLMAILSYCLANAASVLWLAVSGAPAILYETLGASVLVVMLPQALTVKTAEYMPLSSREGGVLRSRVYLRDRVQLTQQAFSRLADSVAVMDNKEANDEDISGIFERAALGVCRRCPAAKQCWQQGYGETMTMLGDASKAMLERGQLTASDLPPEFVDRCKHTAEYVGAVNAELKAWLCRRQYKARFNENLGAVRSRYKDVASVFAHVARQLDSDLLPQTRMEKRLRSFFRSERLPISAVVYRDGRDRLHVELEGSGVGTLRRDPSWLDKVSAVVDTPLRTTSAADDGRTVLMEAEQLTASVGTASAKRRGRGVSGDGSTAFTTDDGKLCVILSDGMGTGKEAGEMSRASIQALADFIRAGVQAETAIGLLESLMMMKNETDVVSATVDMLVLDLMSGDAQLFKCGSAPTYLRRKDNVRRIKAGGFAPGLAPAGVQNSELTKLKMQSGDVAVIISDGVLAGEDDEWLRTALENDTGTVRDLARRIAETSAARYGASDDVTVLTVAVN